MAIVSNPLIGKTKQSAGGITFTSWKGRNVMKNKATQVANPRTISQINQRNQFKGAVQFFKNQKIWLGILMSKIAGNVTASNVFVKKNIKRFLTDSIGVDPTQAAALIFSVGDLAVFSDFTNITASTTMVEFYANQVSNPSKAMPTDETMIVVWDSTNDVWSFFSGAFPDGNHSFDFAGSFNLGAELYIYVLRYSTTNKFESDTYFVGLKTVV
jgi:hypothetical protein